MKWIILLAGIVDLKHRLMDISVIISRAVAEVLTVLFLGGVYLALVVLYWNFVSSDISVPFLVLTILYGILVGQTHQRLRLFIQTTSDKMFLRGKYDYYQELARASEQITQSLSLEDIVATLKRTFYEVIEVANPKIYLAADLKQEEVGAFLSIEEPTFKGEKLVLPCLLEGKLEALFVLGRKLSEDEYTKDDLKLLTALASQTAVALGHLRVYEEMVKAQKQLLWAEKLSSLGRLAASVASKIKKPLTTVKEVVGQVEKNVEVDRELMSRATEEIDEINILLEELVELAKRR